MKIDNDTGSGHCAACDDDGWVDLTNDRGVTACKWCDVGTKRYIRATERTDGKRWMPMMDYDGTDIDPRGLDHGGRFVPDAEFLRQREAAGCSQASLKAMFPRRIWPSEWPDTQPAPLVKAMPTYDASVEEEAQIGRNRAKPPPEPKTGALKRPL